MCGWFFVVDDCMHSRINTARLTCSFNCSSPALLIASMTPKAVEEVAWVKPMLRSCSTPSYRLSGVMGGGGVVVFYPYRCVHKECARTQAPAVATRSSSGST